jgi:uncharacterized hydrophobic protein (TIGR00341 family)
MRLVQIAVPEDQRESFVEVLEDRDLGYTVTDGQVDDGVRSIITFVVPADAVEYVLDDLEQEGFDTKTFTVSVETEYATFDGVDELQDEWAKTPNRIAPETLRSKAKDMRLNTRSYLWMMILSSIIAAAGLLLSSPAVVVGSMVLAPIVSPMLTASVGAVRDDRDMVLDSLQMQGLGLGVAVAVTFLFSLLVKHFFAVPMTLDIRTMEMISIRFSPGMLGAVVGLASGAAGAFGLATKGQVSIIGVMIAAALIPTAAASGIGFAWGVPVVGFGSLALLLVTIIAVNVGGVLMLTYLDYRPDEVDEGFFELSTAREFANLALTALAVLVVVTAVSFGAYQQFTFERSVNTATTEVLDRGNYEDLEVLAITAEYVGAGPFSDPAIVTVTLSRATDRSYGDLPDEFAQAIRERTDERVRVHVQYQDFDQSSGPAPSVRRSGTHRGHASSTT